MELFIAASTDRAWMYSIRLSPRLNPPSIQRAAFQFSSGDLEEEGCEGVYYLSSTLISLIFTSYSGSCYFCAPRHSERSPKLDPWERTGLLECVSGFKPGPPTSLSTRSRRDIAGCVCTFKDGCIWKDSKKRSFKWKVSRRRRVYANISGVGSRATWIFGVPAGQTSFTVPLNFRA